MKIRLIDSMSVLRRRLEAKERQLMRGVVNDCIAPGAFNIWVFDGVGGNDARRKLYPAYKAHRPPVRTDIFEALYLLRELIALTPAWQARLDGFEGDDVIAALVDHFKGEDVEIHSSDGDLIALGVPVIGATPKVHWKKVRLWKLCVGDRSDNITGIPGFGKETWDRIRDWAGLYKLIDDVINRVEWDDKVALSIGLSRRSINWLRKNPDELAIMRRIIDPLPLTPEQLDAALIKGRDAPAEREFLMEKFHL